jgi:hypothetical protein
MKRFISQLRWIVMLAFALCSIGADSSSSGCKPSDSQSNQGAQYNQNKPWCYTDPPIGCAAFCSDVGVISFTLHCGDIDAGPRTKDFMDAVIQFVNAKIAEGYDVCPAQDVRTKFVTPCVVPPGFPPVEWPNQDHEVCQTPPLDCSIVLP